jgi:hypothetical protein
VIKKIEIFAFTLIATCFISSAKEADDPTSNQLANGDLLITDFEQRDLGRMKAWGWQFQGEAFNREFRLGTQKLRARVGRYEGKWFLTTVTENPKSTGTLTSPNFKIERPYVSFFLSGGSSPTMLQANLIIEGEVVRTANGNDSDAFKQVSFDVQEFQNKEARFQVVDKATSMWGHINLDQIVQTSTPKGRTISKAPLVNESNSGFAQLIDSGKRISGPFNLREGKFTNTKNESTPLENILSINTNNPKSLPDNADFIKFKNGEIWFCTITGIENQSIKVQTRFAGTQAIPLSQISMLEFNKKEKDPENGTQPGTLYRLEGEPIPGKLIWIRQKDIAIESPLGIIPIPRTGVRRFVVSNESLQQANKLDELSLTDGTKIMGSIIIEEGGDHFSMLHSGVGKLRFPINNIHSLKRRPKNVVWLSDLRAKTYKATGLVIPPPAPKIIKPSGDALSSLKVNPKSKITYVAPQIGDGKIIFRSTIVPSEGNRGSVMTSLGSAEKNIITHVEPGSDEQLIQINIESGSILELEVNFQGRLIFPCAVEFRDAHFVSSSAKKENSQPRT